MFEVSLLPVKLTDSGGEWPDSQAVDHYEHRTCPATISAPKISALASASRNCVCNTGGQFRQSEMTKYLKHIQMRGIPHSITQ